MFAEAAQGWPCLWYLRRILKFSRVKKSIFVNHAYKIQTLAHFFYAHFCHASHRPEI